MFLSVMFAFHICLNILKLAHFRLMSLICRPLVKSENLWFLDVVKGSKKGTLA